MSAHKPRREGDRMIGPDERGRCPEHPRRWVIWRWEWEVVDGDEEIDEPHAEPVIVRACGSCEEQAEAEAIARLFGDES